jgi:hypothetical protein
MSFNRRPTEFSMRGIARLAASVLLGALTIAMPMRAQTQFQGPVCAVPPTPQANDGWPYAGPDSLGNATGPLTFAGSFLLSNDRGTNLTIQTIVAASSAGGTITGTDPYTYTPPATAVASDVFTYTIVDGAGQTATGIVKVGVIPDIVNPSVNISAPAAGSTVSGNVTITAVAGDNVGVVRVQFQVDGVQVGNILSSPWSVSWDSRTVPDGDHTMSAIARDAAGNLGESPAVGFKVLNAAPTVSVPNVVGMTQTAAQGAITTAQLALGGVTTASSTTVVAGRVISQNPTAGTGVTTGTPVSLVISTGPPSAAVPSVVGMTQTAAQSTITSNGFAVGAITTANSGTVAAGSVISQTPTGGTNAILGSSIALVVSVGPGGSPAGGLVLALGFDEASGTTAVDSSASPKNGTILQAVRVPGKFGSALKFDGVNDWVTVTDTTSSKLDLTTGMTLEAWVNPSAMSGWETVLYKERGTAGEGLLCYALYAHDGAPLSGGKAVPAGYVRLNNATQTSDKAVRGTAKLPLNTWTHIATTYDGTVQKFYVNGVLVGTANPIVAPSLNTIVQSNGTIRIGGNASSTGEFFQGLIDEVRVYNRALSATEIGTDMITKIVQ